MRTGAVHSLLCATNASIHSLPFILTRYARAPSRLRLSMSNHTAAIEGDDMLIFFRNFSSASTTIMAPGSPNSLYLDPTVDQAAAIR